MYKSDFIKIRFHNSNIQYNSNNKRKLNCIKQNPSSLTQPKFRSPN